MLVRQDFSQHPQLPPRPFLEQVMDGLTRFYCFMWDHKNNENRFSMTWKEALRYYNKNSFRSNLRKLNNHGLLNYSENEDGISIELVGWDEVVQQG